MRPGLRRGAKPGQSRVMQSAPPPPAPLALHLRLADEAATAALARALRPQLRPGDVIALAGPIGAGKTAFARALVQDALAAEGRREDVPSPSFTLVQAYDTAQGEIWHADLYRLSGPRDTDELGLAEAFDRAICLVEWPDRLGPDLPARALTLTLAPDAEGEARTATLTATDARWEPVLGALADG